MLFRAFPAALLVLAVSCAEAPGEVTFDNFRSIRFEQSGGFAGLHSSLLIKAGGRAEYRFEVGSINRSEVKQLSLETMNALFEALNRNDFLTLSGSFKQEGADLFDETIRLVTDRKVAEVQNRGESAPRRYLNVRDHLLDLVARHFP